MNKKTNVSLNLNKEKIQRWSLARQKRQALALPCDTWLGKLCHSATLLLLWKRRYICGQYIWKKTCDFYFPVKRLQKKLQVFKEKGRHQNYQVILISFIEGLGHILFFPSNKASGARRLFLQGMHEPFTAHQQCEGLSTSLAPAMKARQIGIHWGVPQLCCCRFLPIHTSGHGTDQSRAAPFEEQANRNSSGPQKHHADQTPPGLLNSSEMLRVPSARKPWLPHCIHL